MCDEDSHVHPPNSAARSSKESSEGQILQRSNTIIVDVDEKVYSVLNQNV